MLAFVCQTFGCVTYLLSSSPDEKNQTFCDFQNHLFGFALEKMLGKSSKHILPDGGWLHRDLPW